MLSVDRQASEQIVEMDSEDFLSFINEQLAPFSASDDEDEFSSKLRTQRVFA